MPKREFAASTIPPFSTSQYFADETEGWILGRMVSKQLTGDALKMDHPGAVSHVQGLSILPLQRTTFEGSIAQLAKNGFADLPPLKNPELMDMAEDLAQLSYLHEPAVFWGVKNRFSNKNIYTYSGIVLIAMNPFQKIDMYAPDVMREYAGKTREELEPHLFAIAEEAYRAMLRGRNQSIIVSGESGAGKTQSTKYIMRYFATVDSLSKIDGVEALMRPELMTQATEERKSEIEEAVLATNPILESFGNAKTTRNDNSSRFGKFIEIFFSKPESGNVRITGAQIRTYLLERSRLLFQPLTERNYHIFYQLCAAAPAAEREELGLGKWQDFFYLNQGRAGVVKTIDDVGDFELTQKALSTIGMSVTQQWKIFRVCAALLHIGNIKITGFEGNNDKSFVPEDDPAMVQTCKLLHLNQAEFTKWMTKRQIITGKEKFLKDLKVDMAVVVRDSVAKFIYIKLFDWLVRNINKNLKRGSKGDESFTGVLDIYGFEHFEINSFEQFCINYANEKLQQEFNSHVFRLEQELYMREKIVWKMIDFNDNQPCIDLIEGKFGILDILDEETRLPAGLDSSFLSKLNQRFANASQKFYEKPRFGNSSFTVKHYACRCHKNKDSVSQEQHEVLSSSSFSFLTEIIAKSSSSSKKATLGSMFKASLVQLMQTIRATESHYIRCIKPNMAKSAFGFEGPMVLSQLRACGVLETIKISCAGYPNKMTHKQFALRYRLLVKSRHWDLPDRDLCEMIVKTVLQDPDKYQFGTTQVFLRSGQIASFENRRTERQTFLMVLGQKNIKRFIQRRKYLRLRESTIKIQAGNYFRLR
ncbi:P-loop containing nucleoside triphosphate hydrolase protein [Zopfochytrium polystomum]|nr:P-loop containing nucleoside triphosphate hydrolase protein [Zopfochytrium polystomum]